VTIDGEKVEARLRGVWPGVELGRPTPLTGGFWATMFRVPVSGQPEGVADEVVVRAAPHRSMGAKEAEVQRAIAAQGFPTPAIHVSCPDEESGGWWSVMDFVPAAPLLDGLDGLAALRRAPALARTLPVQLAQATAALHRLAPAPVAAAVREAAPEVAFTPDALLEQFRAGAGVVGREDLAAALGRLAATAPAPIPAADVVCHGDLHPFNVLDRDGELVVLDWTGAILADPCFDVAFTELLLANPPLALPGPLATIGRGVGRLLARRFVTAYAAANPGAAMANLGWYRALHSARVLLEVANRRVAHGPGAGGHPFTLVAPAAAANLAAATGVDVVH
jgi:aminoglycoside phosphotransferase (APT) family kinase protein